MKKEKYRVGFIGVGRMGANMARRLKEQGYHVEAVYDCEQARSEQLARELGCDASGNPAGVAERTNTILTVVTDDDAMGQIYAEERADSLLKQANGRLFINCATLSPDLHLEVERLVRMHGGHTLEACMASSIPQARQGTLYLMCAGEREAFDQARPLLESISASLRYVGTAGEAAKVKALVNMVMNANTAALAEGLGLGAAHGLDVAMLREIFAQTGAASRVLETDGEDMQNREHECFFSTAHALKDCGIALKLAEQARLKLPVARATLEQYRRLVELGKGELDKSAVAELTFKGRAGRG